MAKGLDHLLDFLLAEVALCGTQGKYTPKTQVRAFVWADVLFVHQLPSLTP